MKTERESVEMHSAVCSECKQACEVPFKPTGSKPVSCRDCFKQSSPKRDGSRGSVRPQGGSFGERTKSRPTIDYSKQLEAISAKMDKIIRLLETGSLERPDGGEAKRIREERQEEKVVDHDALREVIDQTG